MLFKMILVSGPSEKVNPYLVDVFIIIEEKCNAGRNSQWPFKLLLRMVTNLFCSYFIIHKRSGEKKGNGGRKCSSLVVRHYT
jgi:hypothetical protein